MWKSGVVAILALLLSLSSESLIVHEKRNLPFHPEHALERRRAESDALLPMRIGLKQNRYAMKNAEAWLMSVSQPDSPQYGQHWSQEEVIDAFKPSEDTLQNVTEWLHSYGITDFTHTDNKLWFAFDASVAKMESMLQTEYQEHMRRDGGFEVSCDHYSLPKHLRSHIDYITPGIKASDMTGHTRRSRHYARTVPAKPVNNQIVKRSETSRKRHVPLPFNATSLVNCSKLVTPACIRALYNFAAPAVDQPVNPNNSLGILETGRGLYYQGDLDEFYKDFTDIPTGTSPIFEPVDGAPYPPNSTNSPLYKLGAGGEADLDIEIAAPIIYPQNVTVFQIGLKAHRYLSGNYYNKFLDAIDGSYCTPAERGNSSEGGRPQCGVFKPTNVLSSSLGSPEHWIPPAWQDRQCNEYLKLGLQGVSVFFDSGDYGVGQLGEWSGNAFPRAECKNESLTRPFMPQFPPSCPWVTAVGATQIAKNHSVYDPEEAADWANKLYASGGGFAIHFEAPSYQREALEYYFQNHNPPWPYFTDGHFVNRSGLYNRNGRGIPDIAANGAKGAVVEQQKSGKDGGTSMATPLVAALFNRIVEERLRAGKGPLGFVNPTLYKHPEALNDIVKGENGFCSHQEGFKCVEGWDPVTGLGTPNYPKLLEIFMALP